MLRQAVEDSGGDSGIAVVMDTHTGELLALADDPTFDAGDPRPRPGGPRGPRAQHVYEPGSVEKVLTLAGAHRRRQGHAADQAGVPPELDRQDRVIHELGPRLIGLTLAGVLAKSSNVGTVLAADKFGPASSAATSQVRPRQPTNVGLGAESPGILPDPSIWTGRPGTGSPSASRSR